MTSNMESRGQDTSDQIFNGLNPAELLDSGDAVITIPVLADRDPTAEGNYERLLDAYQNVYGEPAVIIPPEPIVRRDGRTLFTSSGIQCLYGGAFDGQPYPEGPRFINQPVIRTNYFARVAPGSYTSFVNPGTFRVNTDPVDHAAAFTRYVEAVRAFTPADREIAVRFGDGETKWSSEGESFPARVARVTIDGVEVGDAIFTPALPTVGGPAPSVSEFGLSPTRLAHAIGGEEVLASVTGREVTQDTVGALDAVRTMTLMVGSGVLPGNKDHGYQVRRLAKRLASTELPDGFNITTLVARCHEDWSRYTNLDTDPAATARIIEQEFGRNVSGLIIGELAVTGRAPKVDTNRGPVRTLTSLRVHGVNEERLAAVSIPGIESIRERIPERTLAVCDYHDPRNGYPFPNHDMGAAENGIWRFAESATHLDNLRVITVGPMWQPEYTPGAIHVPYRLDSEAGVNRFLAEFGPVDYLYGGYEYFDDKEQMARFRKVSDNQLTYIDWPYEFAGPHQFDGRTKFLFCTTDDFMNKYASQKPLKSLRVHTGPGQEPFFNPDTQDHLVWMGRHDRQKQLHIAIMAAGIAGKNIVVLGQNMHDPEYGEFVAPYLKQPHVDYRGVLSPADKQAVVGTARALVYTQHPSYMEAAAGVLSESLTNGTPVAGMTWRGNDAILEAVDRPEFGSVADVRGAVGDTEVAERLASAIRVAVQIDHAATFASATEKYDSVKITHRLLDMINSRSSVTEKFPERNPA